MTSRSLASALALATLAVTRTAAADPPPSSSPAPAAATPAVPAPAPAPAPAPTTAPPAAPAPATETAAPTTADVERRLRALEEENRKLHDQVEQMKDDNKYTQEQVKQLLPLTTRISGFLDVGFFYVQGNGSGIRPDTNYQHFPEYNTGSTGVPGQWVFMGDPLATMVNARGEPADTDGSRAITFDPIHNGGAPSFIVNSLTLNLFEGIGDNFTVNGAVDFVPRNRDPSDPNGIDLGAFIDVRLAYGEWIVPTKSWDLSIYAGKFDSVLGIEYRSQDAANRLTVTPSLICRYTCGYPLGIKARAKFFDEKLILNTAVTNGSSFVEMFPFSDELALSAMKSGSARLSYRFPLGDGLEFGVSGLWGAQNNQTSNTVYQYQYGGDVSLDWNDIIVQGEVLHGQADGAGTGNPTDPPCNIAPCLNFTGAYGLLGYRLFNWLTPYARVDYRDALHRSGSSFVYISDLMRTTGGLHFEIGTNFILKAEYTHIIELGRVPQFNDDVATSSFVVKY